MDIIALGSVGNAGQNCASGIVVAKNRHTCMLACTQQMHRDNGCTGLAGTAGAEDVITARAQNSAGVGLTILCFPNAMQTASLPDVDGSSACAETNRSCR